MKQLAHQSVLILGLGASGLALARWCARAGAQVTVADTRDAPPQLVALRSTLPGAVFVHSAMDASLLAGKTFDTVLKSPGLAPSAVAGVMAEVQARGLVCGNELTLFAQALKDLKENTGYAPQVIGITGTNGKTTVTSLTGQLLSRAGMSVAVAGNIGPTLLDTLTQGLDTGELPEVWVLELSSFQLDGIDNFAPTVATVLNITQDHLDWHETLAAYTAAKRRVFGEQGLMLLNRDDPRVMAMCPPAAVPTKGKAPPRSYITFGTDEPARPGDYGIETVNGMAWLVRAAVADETVKRRGGEEQALYIQRLMPTEALRIRGRHNASNALAALALAVAAGGPLAPMLHGLREYRGEPHRVESVTIIDDVEYFDDSKGTNVGATVAALSGLGLAASELPVSTSGRKLVVILGGQGKGQDFSPLAEPVARYARAVVLIGEAAPQIQAALQAVAVLALALPVFHAASMAEAVALAAAQAQTGDAVLLSPACASFDMFTGYEHRAQVFTEAVHAMAQAQRAVV